MGGQLSHSGTGSFTTLAERRKALFNNFERLGVQDAKTGTTTITYNFDIGADYAPSTFSANHQPLTPQQQQHAEAVMREIESVANVKFIQQSDSKAHITFSSAVPGADEQYNKRYGDWDGLNFRDPQSQDNRQAVVLRRDRVQPDENLPNQRIHGVLLHEVLHALGLSHPGEKQNEHNNGQNSAFTRADTVMSYNPPLPTTDTNRMPRAHMLGELDIYSLQERYGAAIGLQPIRALNASAVEKEVATLYAPKEVQLTEDVSFVASVNYLTNKVTVYQPERGVLVRPSVTSIAEGTEVQMAPDSNSPIHYRYIDIDRDVQRSLSGLVQPFGQPSAVAPAQEASKGIGGWLGGIFGGIFGGSSSTAKSQPSAQPSATQEVPEYRSLRGAGGDDYFELNADRAEVTTGKGNDTIAINYARGTDNRVIDFDPAHDRIVYGKDMNVELIQPAGSADVELRFTRRPFYEGDKSEDFAPLIIVGGASMDLSQLKAACISGDNGDIQREWRERVFKQLLKHDSPPASTIPISQYDYGDLYVPPGATLEFRPQLDRGFRVENTGHLDVYDFDPKTSKLLLNTLGKSVSERYSESPTKTAPFDTLVTPIDDTVSGGGITIKGQALTPALDAAIQVVPPSAQMKQKPPEQSVQPPSPPASSPASPAATTKPGDKQAFVVPEGLQGVALSASTPEGATMDINAGHMRGAAPASTQRTV